MAGASAKAFGLTKAKVVWMEVIALVPKMRVASAIAAVGDKLECAACDEAGWASHVSTAKGFSSSAAVSGWSAMAAALALASAKTSDEAKAVACSSDSVTCFVAMTRKPSAAAASRTFESDTKVRVLSRG
eukprot:2965761-Pleurochrysis_carterae.AAC.4